MGWGQMIMRGMTARGEIRWIVLLVVGAMVMLFSWGERVQAAPGCGPQAGDCPPLLSEFGSFGQGAGQLAGTPFIATDPTTGHIFVSETANGRISEFDAEENWSFVKAWGWGVRDGSAELQVCTSETGCVAGQEGPGSGQMSFPFGITIDGAGNIWVLELFNLRVQKFSPEGEFLLMVGGEVNKTKVEEREEQEANAEPVTVSEAEENLCTAASGDVCGVGVEGTGDGDFEVLISDSIALGPGGTVYVGDENRIQKFAEDGTYKGDIPLPGAGITESLAIAPDGSIYVISAGVKEGSSTVVREIGPAGEEIRRLKGQWQGRTVPKNPQALAIDAEENVYVAGSVTYELPPEKEGDPPVLKDFEEVIAFEADGDLISFEPDRAGFDRPTDKSRLFSLATNVVGDDSGDPGEVLVGHFVSAILGGGTALDYVRSYGIPFKVTEGPPEITDQFVVSATDSEAVVEALINPRFTADTNYQVEYGTGKCSEGKCELVAPVPPASLGTGSTPLETGPVELVGLAPGTVYHFRFSAQNGKGSATFAGEGTFRTFAEPSPPPSCPNSPLRFGPSAALPDCRAYEMVSPVDKDGGEIFVLRDVPTFPAEINQGSLDGGALTYSSYRAFADPDSAPYTSQYMAERDPMKGWVNESISPPREGLIVANFETQYRAFSGDLSRGWLVTDSEPVLAEGGLPGYRNLYRRDSDTGAYQAQCATVPISAIEYRLEPQGSSVDGSHLVFSAEGQLPGTGAAPGKVPQLYECVNGADLRLVSVLPGGSPNAVGSSAGSALGGLGGDGFHVNNVASAVSEDGSRIFWTAAATGPGPLYVRIDGDETVEIAAANARFRAASPDGSRVIYSVGEGLFEASVGPASAVSTQIAGKVDGVLGMSEGTQLVYLVSEEDLDSAGPAQAGEHNLYLYRAQPDSFTFIGELSADDARETFKTAGSAPVLTPVALSPYNRSSRVTADGMHAAFASTARLTGYDNTDQASGEADAEVFIYDATSEELRCASCNPSGARPRGANVADSINPFWAAAYIPGWENQSHASRALSENGDRLFFNAADPLALGDTNGVQDVYQWEAVGTGTCKEISSTYSPANGGCVDLVSAGESDLPSELVDASVDGDDVFFKTAESLWPADPGLFDIYDARVEGGFPPPPLPVEPCEADCQQRSPRPANLQPPTALPGSGNVVEKPKPKPKKCRKGTHKVRKGDKVRCVKNKAKGRAGRSRRAGR